MNHEAVACTPRARTSPRSVALVFALCLTSLAAGCLTDSDPGLKAEKPPGYTEPAPLVAAYAAALRERDFATYQKLLDDRFVFFPSSSVLFEIPWLTDAEWGYDDESVAISHMLDPQFVCPSAGMGAVTRIVADVAVVSVQQGTDAVLVVSTDARLAVFWNEDDGMRADARLEFHLVTAADGYLRILSMYEQPRLGRSGAAHVDPTTWAELKELFRECPVG